MAEVHRAHAHVGELQRALGDALRALVDAPGRVPPGVEVLCLGQAGGLDQRAHVGAVVRHADPGRRVEAVDQHAHLAFGVEGERTAQAGAALGARPGPGGAEQGGRDGRVVPAVEEAEERDSLFVWPLLVEVGVGLGRDPSHRVPVLEGEEALHLAVLEKGALFRIQRPPVVVEERGDPVRVRLHAQRPGDVQEDLDIFIRLDGADLKRHRGRGT